MSMFTSNQLDILKKRRKDSVEKLSSGYRINQASDDAAGLSISEKMRAQIKGLSRAADNIQDGSSYVRVADGALGEVTDILHRMRELSVQAANDINTESDRENIDLEVQQLKKEIDQIFETTEFNTKKIWDTNTKNKVQIGTEPKQAVTMTMSYQNHTITDTNKGAVPYSLYTINVIGTDPTEEDKYGISVTWTGYNGKNYSTSLISWDKLAGSNVSFDISEYLDVSNYPELEGISQTISFRVVESATIDDISKALDGAKFSASPISSERISNSSENNSVSLGVEITYLAELASGRSMDNFDTDFIQADLSGNPTSNVTTPNYSDPSDSSSLSFDFNMRNIGKVTANCNNIYYYSNDVSADKEGKWWRYVRSGNEVYKTALTYQPSVSGTGLASILSCLSREDGYSLTKDADSNGTIVLNFDLKSNGSFTYGGNTSSHVGSMTIQLRVGDNDTVEDLIDKIKSSFNENSIVDVYAGSLGDHSPSRSYDYSYGAYANTSIIDVPIYEASHDVAIQAGANANNSIHIQYDSLRTMNLGISDTNVLTTINASNAIREIDEALTTINDQRSLFGSYANRLEHAYMISLTSAENLQNSESGIRDLDMAKAVMENAKIDILEQAATSILVQSNQNSEQVLRLLQ